MDSLDTLGLSVLSEALLEKIDGLGLGRLLALTPNEEVNSLAALHLSRGLGKANVLEFAPDPTRLKGTKSKIHRLSHDLRGRILFGGWDDV